MILQPRLYAGAFSCVYRRPVNVKHNQEYSPGVYVSRACVVHGRGCIVFGGAGCSVVRVVVRLFVSLCPACVVAALWGVSRGFYAWVYVYMGLPFPGLVAAFPGLVGVPRWGIDKGRNRAREYAEYPQKIKRPYKR